MIVGDDIAVGGDDEAAAGTGGGGYLTEDVGTGDFIGDAHDRCHILGIDLSGC